MKIIKSAFTLTPLLAVAACASENNTGFGNMNTAGGAPAAVPGPGAVPPNTPGSGMTPGANGGSGPGVTPGVKPGPAGGGGSALPANGGSPAANGGSPAASGGGPAAMGGAGGMAMLPPGQCGAGFQDLGGMCVKTAAICGAGVCGLGQTCAGNACTSPEDLIVVEAENFSERKNPGNVREWYVSSAATVGAGGLLTGFPCIGGYHCEDTSSTNPAERGGAAYIEILPDTRRSHGDGMKTYCKGLELSCADPTITTDVDLAVVKGFPGYVGINTHLDAEFYPIPGDGPAVGYTVNFTKPGQYVVWAASGKTTSEGNSVHVGINGEWPVTGRGIIHCGDQWTWSSNRRADKTGSACGAPGTIFIDVPSAGVHKVWFSMREDGHQLDKWIATLDKAYRPNGWTQPEVGRVERGEAQPAPMPAPAPAQ